MPRSKKNQSNLGNPGMTKAQKRRLPIHADLMTKVEPLTPNQARIFKAWEEGTHVHL